MQVERAEEVVKLPAIWRSPLQLLGLLPVIPVLVDLLDPKVEVAVACLARATRRASVAVWQSQGQAAHLLFRHLVQRPAWVSNTSLISFSKSKSPTRMRRWSGSRKTLTNSTMGSRDIAR